MILAVDPGDTTGLALWDDFWSFKEKAQVPLENFPDYWIEVEDYYGPITLVIVEDFVLFGKRAMQQTGSRMKASQGIGMVKALAAASPHKVEVVVQPSNIKPVAIKLSGIKLPSQHSKTHEYDAFLHGYFYAVKEGKIKTALQKERANVQKA